MTFPEVDLRKDCRDACCVLLQPLAFEDGVSVVQERTGAIRVGSHPSHAPCLLFELCLSHWIAGEVGGLGEVAFALFARPERRRSVARLCPPSWQAGPVTGPG